MRGAKTRILLHRLRTGEQWDVHQPGETRLGLHKSSILHLGESSKMRQKRQNDEAAETKYMVFDREIERQRKLTVKCRKEENAKTRQNPETVAQNQQCGFSQESRCESDRVQSARKVLKRICFYHCS